MKAASLHSRHRRPLAPGLLLTLRDAFCFADGKHQHFWILLEHSLHAESWIRSCALRSHIDSSSHSNQLIDETSRPDGDEGLAIQHVEHPHWSRSLDTLLNCSYLLPEIHGHCVGFRRSSYDPSERLDVGEDPLDILVSQNKHGNLQLLKLDDDFRLEKIVWRHHQIWLQHHQ